MDKDIEMLKRIAELANSEFTVNGFDVMIDYFHRTTPAVILKLIYENEEYEKQFMYLHNFLDKSNLSEKPEDIVRAIYNKINSLMNKIGNK